MRGLVKAHASVFLIPTIYFFAATAWIWISDTLLGRYAADLPPGWFQYISILKGVSFVALTSLLLSFLMFRFTVRVMRSHDATRRALQKIHQVSSANRYSVNELDAIFNNSIVGIVFVDSQLTIRRVNRHFCDIMGCMMGNYVGRPVSCLAELAGVSDVDISMHIAECKEMDHNVEVEFEAEFSGQGRKWLQMSVTKIKAVDGRNGFVIVMRDISTRKRNEERIAYLSYYDFLTSLPNRRLFYEKLNDTLKSAKRYGFTFGVLYMDINNFKLYNDKHGHEFGDTVLKEFARTVGGCLRESDILARLGGDEFAILVGNSDKPVSYEAIIRKVSCRLTEVEQIGGVPVQLSASIGLGVYPDDGDDADALINVADRKMYVDKDRCRMAQAVQ